MNWKKVLIPLIVLVVLVLPVVAGVFYTVHEGEQVVITEFGRPIGQPIVTAGLKVKTPFIQDVHRFEKRVLEWDGSPETKFRRKTKNLSGSIRLRGGVLKTLSNSIKRSGQKNLRNLA